MSEIKIINGQSLPNIPWQERPADLEEGAVLWRYTENPVMGAQSHAENRAYF